MKILYSRLNTDLGNNVERIEDLLFYPTQTCQNQNYECSHEETFEYILDEISSTTLNISRFLNYIEGNEEYKKIKNLNKSIMSLCTFLHDNKHTWFDTTVYGYDTSGQEFKKIKYDHWDKIVECVVDYQGYNPWKERA